MAKLSDLKTLLAGVPRAKRAASRDDAEPASATIKGAVQSAKSAAADLDLAHAFADVVPLASGNRARHAKVPTSASPAKRLADEADALAASRHGLDASPGAWDVGQETEPEQTFRRAGLGADVVSRLRRGHWAVQAELDLHGHTSDEAHAALVLSCRGEITRLALRPSHPRQRPLLAQSRAGAEGQGQALADAPQRSTGVLRSGSTRWRKRSRIGVADGTCCLFCLRVCLRRTKSRQLSADRE